MDTSIDIIPLCYGLVKGGWTRDMPFDFHFPCSFQFGVFSTSRATTNVGELISPKITLVFKDHH